MNGAPPLEGIDVFVRVAEHGSFAAAAEGTGLTASGLSKAVTRLEDRLGVKLMQRTTRRLALTPEGEVLLERGRSILSAMEAAEAEVTVGRGKPRGVLKVNTGTAFARHRLAPILPAFHERHPEISLDLSVADHRVDVIGAQVDVAIRTGPPGDDALVQRRLGEARRLVCASPAYLERRGTPSRPEELSDHTVLGVTGFSRLARWPFRIDGRVQTVAVKPAVLCDSAVILLDFALAGLGIVRLASFMMEEAIAAGRLVPLLADAHVSEEVPITALMPPGRQHVPRVRAFLDFLAAHGRAQPPAP